MPGTYRYSATFDRTYLEEPEPSDPVRVTVQTWQQSQSPPLPRDQNNGQSHNGHHTRSGSTDSQDSSNTSGSNASHTRQLSVDGEEFIPTRTIQVKKTYKPPADPLQFVKIGTAPLYRKAAAQIKLATDTKITKEKVKEEEEEWQNNLDNWKNRRKKVSENVIQRMEDMKKIEYEEQMRLQARKVKTFSEMMEERASRPRGYNLAIYSSQSEEDGTRKRNDSAPSSTKSETNDEGSIDMENDNVFSSPEQEEIKSMNQPHKINEEELQTKEDHKKDSVWADAEIEPAGTTHELPDSCEEDTGDGRAHCYADSGVDSMNGSHHVADSASDLSLDSGSLLDRNEEEADAVGTLGEVTTGTDMLEEYSSKKPLKSFSGSKPERMDGTELDLKLFIRAGGDIKDFGFSMKGGRSQGPVLVENVTPDGAADLAGLHSGDEILAINNESTEGRTLSALNFAIKQAVYTGQLELVIWRPSSGQECHMQFHGPSKVNKRAAAFNEKRALFSGENCDNSTSSKSDPHSKGVDLIDPTLVQKRKSTFEAAPAVEETKPIRKPAVVIPVSGLSEKIASFERQTSQDSSTAVGQKPETPAKKPPAVPAKPKISSKPPALFKKAFEDDQTNVASSEPESTISDTESLQSVPKDENSFENSQASDTERNSDESANTITAEPLNKSHSSSLERLDDLLYGFDTKKPQTPQYEDGPVLEDEPNMADNLSPQGLVPSSEEVFQELEDVDTQKVHESHEIVPEILASCEKLDELLSSPKRSVPIEYREEPKHSDDPEDTCEVQPVTVKNEVIADIDQPVHAESSTTKDDSPSNNSNNLEEEVVEAKNAEVINASYLNEPDSLEINETLNQLGEGQDVDIPSEEDMPKLQSPAVVPATDDDELVETSVDDEPCEVDLEPKTVEATSPSFPEEVLVSAESIAEQMERNILQQLEEEERRKSHPTAQEDILDNIDDAIYDIPDVLEGPPTQLEPPKEKPPPPPPMNEEEDSEASVEKKPVAPKMNRNNSTKRIKAEIWKRRSNFLGIEPSEFEMNLDESNMPMPPDVEEILKSEIELERQWLEREVLLKKEAEEAEIDRKEREIIEALEREEQQNIDQDSISTVETPESVPDSPLSSLAAEDRIEKLQQERRKVEQEISQKQATESLSPGTPEEEDALFALSSPDKSPEKADCHMQGFLPSQEISHSHSSSLDSSDSVRSTREELIRASRRPQAIPGLVKAEDEVHTSFNVPVKHWSPSHSVTPPAESPTKASPVQRSSPQKAKPSPPAEVVNRVHQDVKSSPLEESCYDMRSESKSRTVILEFGPKAAVRSPIEERKSGTGTKDPVHKTKSLPSTIDRDAPGPWNEALHQPVKRPNHLSVENRSSVPRKMSPESPHHKGNSSYAPVLKGKPLYSDDYSRQQIPPPKRRSDLPSARESRYNQNHWLIQEAEMRRQLEESERQRQRIAAEHQQLQSRLSAPAAGDIHAPLWNAAPRQQRPAYLSPQSPPSTRPLHRKPRPVSMPPQASEEEIFGMMPRQEISRSQPDSINILENGTHYVPKRPVSMPPPPPVHQNDYYRYPPPGNPQMSSKGRHISAPPPPPPKPVTQVAHRYSNEVPPNYVNLSSIHAQSRNNSVPSVIPPYSQDSQLKQVTADYSHGDAFYPSEHDQMLSVSGRKRCSHCGEELGRGAAMIIETLQLFYHIHCFRCCVCQAQLGNGSCGTDVRVRNNKLHCQNCYSNDEAGVKLSRV